MAGLLPLDERLESPREDRRNRLLNGRPPRSPVTRKAACTYYGPQRYNRRVTHGL